MLRRPGLWETADGRFVIYRDNPVTLRLAYRRGWRLNAWRSTDRQLLKAVGLIERPFPTRRDALIALTAMLHQQSECDGA